MTPKCPDCKRDQDECSCSSPVRSNNEALHHAMDLLRSEVNKQSAALKLAREALDTISSLEASNGCILSLRECVDIAEEALAAIDDALKGE